MPIPKAVLWDMDGVLADTSTLHFQTWERILTEQGIHFDRQKFRHIYGLKNNDLLLYLVGKPMEPALVQWIADQKELAFRQSLHGKLTLLPGVLDWLNRFHARGWKQAVASSAPAENVEALVDELEIRSFFAALVTPGDFPGKPDPAVFLEASRQLRIPPRRCLVIEDSIPGVKAASKTKMRCIAIANTNPPEIFTQADIVVCSLDQLTVKQLESLFL